MKIVEHKNIPTVDEKTRTKRSLDSIKINHFLFDPNTVKKTKIESQAIIDLAIEHIQQQ